MQNKTKQSACLSFLSSQVLCPLSGSVPYMGEAVHCGGGTLPLGPEHLCSCVNYLCIFRSMVDLNKLPNLQNGGEGNIDLTTVLKLDLAYNLVHLVNCKALTHF